MSTIPIEPELAVALALQSAPGAYALLVGSGVSRAAGIPTGWEVVEDLIRRVAALRDSALVSAADFNPEAWYRSTYGAEPSYTALLEQLAATPAERRALLRQYFEPTPAEREQGLKTPTKAHRAIARLVAAGHMRVIITTNFDQLLETALRDEGIVPAVVSTVDAIAGMMPLHLSPATIVKVHGDYLDSRIRNTQAELATYPAKLKVLLGRIFDEYGLIVAGWSAAWDEAMRTALERVRNRRFTAFWAQRGALTPEARRLVEQRGAQVIAVDSADAFFEAVAERVTSLSAHDRRHPLSVAVAVATAKRYVATPADRVRLHDLLADEADRVARTTREIIPWDRAPHNWPEGVELITRLDAVAETMTALMATVGFWAEPMHRALLVSTLERIANGGTSGAAAVRTSYVMWSQLALYPAQRAFYAAGIAALARRDGGEATLADLMLTPRIRSDSKREVGPPVDLLHVRGAVDYDFAKHIPGHERRHTPFSDYLFETLREPLRSIIPDEATFADTFDRFEYYISLAYGGRRFQQGSENAWVPVGRYGWRRQTDDGRRVLQAIAADVERAGPEWFLLGAVDGSVENLRTAQKRVQDHLANIRWW